MASIKKYMTKKKGVAYRITIYQGFTPEGKQIRKNATFYPPPGVSEGKADKLAAQYAYDFERECEGLTSFDANTTLAELVDWYFTQIAPHKLKEKTLVTNRFTIDTYVLPYLGHKKLKDITTARIDLLFNHLHENGRVRETYRLKNPDILADGTRRTAARITGISHATLTELARGGTCTKPTAAKLAKAQNTTIRALFTLERSGGPLSQGTIQRIRTALSPIFNTAIKKELAIKNPVTNATTPRDPRKERATLTAEDCAAILARLDGAFYNPQMPRIITTLIYTGMRVGELCALHWDDVDLDEGYVTIRYTLHRIGGQYRLDTPKTESSARTIAIPPQLIDVLTEQYEWQTQRAAELGSKWERHGAVFTGQYGNYLHSGYINTEFKKFLDDNDLPPVHVHDLRHANASLLINMGVPVKVIAEHLGHIDTRTTEKVYAHVFASSMRQASRAIAEAFTEYQIEDVDNNTENHTEAREVCDRHTISRNPGFIRGLKPQNAPSRSTTKHTGHPHETRNNQQKHHETQRV